MVENFCMVLLRCTFECMISKVVILNFHFLIIFMYNNVIYYELC